VAIECLRCCQRAQIRLVLPLISILVGFGNLLMGKKRSRRKKKKVKEGVGQRLDTPEMV
jgi:hypothetical protein